MSLNYIRKHFPNHSSTAHGSSFNLQEHNFRGTHLWLTEVKRAAPGSSLGRQEPRLEAGICGACSRCYMAKLTLGDPLHQAAAMRTASWSSQRKTCVPGCSPATPRQEEAVTRLENATRRAERDLVPLIPKQLSLVGAATAAARRGIR